MSNPITTSSLSPSDISTNKKANETTGQWVSRHNDAVCRSTPASDPLVTTWTSANGAQSKSTTRKQGESDRDFVIRHMNEFLIAAADEPPIP